MKANLGYVGRQLLLILGVFLLCLIFLALGLVLGYSVFGQGENPFAILSPSKWQAIFAQFTG